jgi:hypothetical protein
LQALPTDTKPVTMWDFDEAFTVIAKGIRQAAERLLASSPESSKLPSEPIVEAVPAETKRKAKAIVQVFERGRPRSYVAIDSYGGDMYFGYTSASLKQGQLSKLLNAYCAEADARFADSLRPYLDRVTAADPTLMDDTDFASALRLASTPTVGPARQGRHDQ